jgi:hypothetical protein
MDGMECDEQLIGMNLTYFNFLRYSLSMSQKEEGGILYTRSVLPKRLC